MKSSRFKVKAWFISMALAMLSMFSATSAHAADGCKFLLCIAGPWASISQCVSTVREVFRDLARGRGFPTCDMSGSGNTANNTWTNSETCPPMYRLYGGESDAYYGCTYPGRISVYVDGSLWSQVFWNMGGGTATWYSDAAKASLAQQPGALPLDDVFNNDLNGWNATRISECRTGGGTVELDMLGAFKACNYPSFSWGGGQ